MRDQTFKATFVQGFKTWILPRLIELPESRWDEAVKQAQAIDFDILEGMALILGVVTAAYLLQVDTSPAPRVSLTFLSLFNYFEAFLLLVLLVGPFYLRRARRGLDLFIAAQDKVQKPGQSFDR